MKPFQMNADDDQAASASCFSADSLEKLMGKMRSVAVDAGHYLYREGDIADKLYYIRKGKVECAKTNEHGKEIVLHLFRDGDLIGQLDPYAQSSENFSAKAVEPCQVGIVQKDELELLLRRHGGLAVEFMRWMGTMHRMNHTKFRQLLLAGE